MNKSAVEKQKPIHSLIAFLKEQKMVLFFLVLALFLARFSGNSLTSLGTDASSRFFRNILLITALVLPIMSGIGLNFGITLGAMSAELALVIIMIFQIDNSPLSVFYWMILTVIICIITGRMLAALFNRTKGHEMIAGLLVGFFANGIYDFILMVICGDILKINVNGLALKKGLPIKATISLSDALTSVMDNALPVAYFYIMFVIAAILGLYFLVSLIVKLKKGVRSEEKKALIIRKIAGIVLTGIGLLICMNSLTILRFLFNVDFPTVTALFSVVVITIVYRLMKSKLGHDFISIRNDRAIAASVGIDVDDRRTKSIILSTIIAGLGQLLYIQNLGTMNTYIMHNTVGTYAIAAILIGGATVKNANIKNVLVGNILFQIIYGCAPNAAKILMGNSQIGEYFRVFLCYTIIAAAIVSNAMQEVAMAKRKAEAM